MSGFGYDVLGFGSGAGVAGPEVDDEFDRTSFLSHFDGANNGVNNAFDDGSTNNHTVTANGNVTQGSFGPFARPDGEWGVEFDGTGDRVRANWSDNISNSDFTIEAWVFISGAMSQYDCIAWLQESTHGSNGDNGFCIRANNANTIEFGVFNGSTIYNTISSAISLNEWHYLTLSKSGTTMYSSVDGTVTSRSAPSALNNAKYLNIGAADAGGSISYAFNGVISNVRLLKGTALYTSNFTVPTSPLTAITNTKFLGCQSNGFVDNSANNYAVTAAGNAAVSAFGPFLTDAAYDPAVNGASAYFDGASDYLRCDAALDSFTATSSVTTIDGWFYWNGTTSSFEAIVACNAAANGSNEMVLSVQPDGTFEVRYAQDGVGNDHFTMGSVNKNEWNFFSVQFNNGSNAFQIFLNGSSVLTKANALNVYLSNCTFLIGTEADGANAGSLGNWWSGHFSDIRVSNNARSASVPTSSFSSDGNTKLLLNMADGQAIDSAAQNNLTLNGNAKLSTGQAKFGDTSLVLDGSGDWAYVYPQVFKFGTSDFTIEFQMRFAAVANVTIASFLSATNASNLAPHIYSEGSGVIKYYVGSIGAVITGPALSADQWYHIAVSRSGTSTKLFVDGTQSGSTYSDSNNYVAGPLVLGGYGYPSVDTGGLNMNGFIDEVRISKMARYTANFTAPTKPFPDQGQLE